MRGPVMRRWMLMLAITGLAAMVNGCSAESDKSNEPRITISELPDSSIIATLPHAELTLDEDDEVREVDTLVMGFYASGFESSGFRSCDGTLRMWTGGSDLGKRYSEIAENRGEEVYVELYGTLRGPGRYGHLGASKYMFTVHEVETIRVPRLDDCGDESNN
jgi:hypothetical protein